MKILFTSLLLLVTIHTGALAADSISKLDEEKLDQSGTVLTIIFDNSGSMLQENKMTQAKEAFREWLATVPDTYRIGLVALNGGLLVKWSRGNKSEVADAVARMQVQGGTPLADTIGSITGEIKKRQRELPFERHVLVVFTDGEDSTTRGTDGVRQELIRASHDLVETVGIGFHGQGDYMSGVATRYFDAGSTEELRRGLDKVDSEIGDTSDVVISDEVLREMKTVHASSLRPPMPATASSDSASTTTPSSHRSRSSGSAPFSVILIGIIVLFAILPKVFKFLK